MRVAGYLSNLEQGLLCQESCTDGLPRGQIQRARLEEGTILGDDEIRRSDEKEEEEDREGDHGDLTRRGERILGACRLVYCKLRLFLVPIDPLCSSPIVSTPMHQSTAIVLGLYQGIV